MVIAPRSSGEPRSTCVVTSRSRDRNVSVSVSFSSPVPPASVRLSVRAPPRSAASGASGPSEHHRLKTSLVSSRASSTIDFTWSCERPSTGPKLSSSRFTLACALFASRRYTRSSFMREMSDRLQALRVGRRRTAHPDNAIAHAFAHARGNAPLFCHGPSRRS